MSFPNNPHVRGETSRILFNALDKTGASWTIRGLLENYSVGVEQKHQRTWIYGLLIMTQKNV